MQEPIIRIREQWRALCDEVTTPGREMKILTLAALKDGELEAIAAGCADPMNRVFREALPLTVARIKDEAQAEMMLYANDPNICFKRINAAKVFNGLDAAEDNYKEMFREDMTRVHKALFATEETYGAEAEMRAARRARVSILHQDGGGEGYPGVFIASYICRVGALATWYISGQDQLNATDKVRGLIETATKITPAGRAARQELYAQKILAPGELGDVRLMLARRHDETGNVGTMHCSAPIPPSEPFSAFLHIRGVIPQ